MLAQRPPFAQLTRRPHSPVLAPRLPGTLRTGDTDTTVSTESAAFALFTRHAPFSVTAHFLARALFAGATDAPVAAHRASMAVEAADTQTVVLAEALTSALTAAGFPNAVHADPFSTTRRAEVTQLAVLAVLVRSAPALDGWDQGDRHPLLRERCPLNRRGGQASGQAPDCTVGPARKGGNHTPSATEGVAEKREEAKQRRRNSHTSISLIHSD